MGRTGPLPAVKKTQQTRDEAKKLDRPTDIPDQAGKVWDRISHYLRVAGRLQPEDGPALERFCRSFAMWKQAMLEIETGEMVVKMATGVTAPNQHFKALAILDAQVERGLRHFGLSPATRGALNASNPDSEIEEFDDFLAGRPGAEAKD